MPYERPVNLIYPIETPPEENQPSSGRGAQDYWEGNVAEDWARNEDHFAHNEALAAYEREAQGAEAAFKRESDFNAKEAEKQREWEKLMSDTAFQRKVADYQKAGFSPLAALEGSVGASTPSGSSATATGHKPSAQAASKGSNGFGGLIGSLIAAVAMIATKGVSALVSKNASSAVSAEQAAKIASNERIAQMKVDAYKEVHSKSWANKIAKEQEEKIRAEMFRKAEEREIARLRKRLGV